MKIRQAISFFSVMLLMSTSAYAQYKCTANGRTVFQNEPCSGAPSTGKYRCLIDGEVVYRSESCAKKPIPAEKELAGYPDYSSAPLPKPRGRAFSASQEPNDPAWIIKNQELIKTRLKDPDSAKFSAVFVSRLSGSPVVCGMVNAKNSFGGYSGPQRFISAGSVVQALESEMASGEMNKLWPQLCE